MTAVKVPLPHWINASGIPSCRPCILVQVKSRDGDIKEAAIQSLKGATYYESKLIKKENSTI